MSVISYIFILTKNRKEIFMTISILNTQTTNQEFLDFAVSEIHNVVVSTVDSNGLPSAQVCDLLLNENNKLYITTSKNNHPFFDNLDNAHQIVINGYKGNGTMDSCGFSIEGDIRNIHHDLIEKIFEKNSYLNEIYQDNLVKAKEELQIFEIIPTKASYLDHRTNPIFYRKFKF